MAKTYIGDPCEKPVGNKSCAGKRRYVSNRACVRCVKRAARTRYYRRKAEALQEIADLL